MVPQMPQGHFMQMNPMPSGSGPPGNMPPGGNQMFQPGGPFNRPQAGQMPMMPGINPYQVRILISSAIVTIEKRKLTNAFDFEIFCAIFV